MPIKRLIAVATKIVLAVVLLFYFYNRAAKEAESMRETYSNLFVYWLAGDLIFSGASPYDPQAWLTGHQIMGFEPVESIFLYPLPLAVLLAPLGLLTYAQALVTWKFLSQIFLAVSILLMLFQWQYPPVRRLFIPLVIVFLYYGPMILAGRSGSISPPTLLILCLVILLLQNQKNFFAGLLLSLTLLKPPQAAGILLLAGFWFLIKRDYKTLYGIVAGGLVLWFLGAIIDPAWVGRFLGGGESAFGRRLGFQSTAISFAHLVCGGYLPCSYGLGAALTFLLLGAGAFLLWKRQSQWSAWEAFNLIIPISFVSAIYLWSYDQLIFVIPLIWIIATLTEKSKSYIFPVLYLIVVISHAFYSMSVLGVAESDLTSLGNTILVMLGLLGAYMLKPKVSDNNPLSGKSN